MYRVVKSALFVATIAISHAASAMGCDKVEREDQLEACLAEQFSLTDRELNSAYSKLRAGLNSEGKVLLAKAQRLWVSLRDADCEFEAESHKGGSGYQAVFIQCQIDKTLQRIKDFKGSKLRPPN